MISAGIIISLALICAGFAYLSIAIGQEHWPLQLAFLGGFSIFATINSFIMMSSVVNFSAVYSIMSNLSFGFASIMIMIFAYIMIYMIIKAFDLFGD